MKRLFMMFAICAATLSSGICAQEGTTDPTELMRQIKRNLQKIEDELNRIRTAPSGSDAGAREKDIETLKRRQDQVVKDIDEIIKQMKQQSGGGSSDESPPPPDSKSKEDSQSGQKPKSRDRNKSQQDQGKQPQGGKKPQGGQKKDGETGKKPQGGKEDNSQPNSGKPENQKGSQPPQDPRRRLQQVDVNEVWGILPPEIRQKLIDRNFGEFTPEYEDEVREYIKKVSTGR